MKKVSVALACILVLVVGILLLVPGKTGRGEDFLIKAAEDNFYGEIENAKIDCIGFATDEYNKDEEHRLYWFIRSSEYTDSEYLALDVICKGKDRFRLCAAYLDPARAKDCAVVRWSDNYTCFLINNKDCTELNIATTSGENIMIVPVEYPFIYCHHDQYPTQCSFAFLSADGKEIK